MTYQRLFKSDAGISGLQRLYLLATTSKCPVESFDNRILSGSGVTALFRGMEDFHLLIGRHDEIKQALAAMTKLEFVPKKPGRPFVGVHVRLDDYAKPQNGEAVPWTSRLPLDWYNIAAAHEVRKTAGGECEVIVFSDGSDDDLGGLLKLPVVRRSNYKESISDILALSQSAVVIGSCSSWLLDISSGICQEMAGRMGRDYDAAQGAISQRRYLSLCSCNAQRAASWGIGLFAVFAATLNQRAVLFLFLSFCVGLIPRKIKSTQNDEEPSFFQYVGRLSGPDVYDMASWPDTRKNHGSAEVNKIRN